LNSKVQHFLKLDLSFYFDSLGDFGDLIDSAGELKAGLFILKEGFKIGMILNFRNVFGRGLGLCVRLILVFCKNRFFARFVNL
jgi:hypothetical protein